MTITSYLSPFMESYVKQILFISAFSYRGFLSGILWADWKATGKGQSFLFSYLLLKNDNDQMFDYRNVSKSVCSSICGLSSIFCIKIKSKRRWQGNEDWKYSNYKVSRILPFVYKHLHIILLLWGWRDIDCIDFLLLWINNYSCGYVKGGWGIWRILISE